MKVDVVMPQMGESVAESTITKWYKQVGDRVERDEELLELSADKVDADVPSPVSGVVVEILHQQGETVAVNTKIAVIETEIEAGVSEKRENKGCIHAQMAKNSQKINEMLEGSGTVKVNQMCEEGRALLEAHKSPHAASGYFGNLSEGALNSLDEETRKKIAELIDKSGVLQMENLCREGRALLQAHKAPHADPTALEYFGHLPAGTLNALDEATQKKIAALIEGSAGVSVDQMCKEGRALLEAHRLSHTGTAGHFGELPEGALNALDEVTRKRIAELIDKSGVLRMEDLCREGKALLQAHKSPHVDSTALGYFGHLPAGTLNALDEDTQKKVAALIEGSIGVSVDQMCKEGRALLQAHKLPQGGGSTGPFGHLPEGALQAINEESREKIIRFLNGDAKVRMEDLCPEGRALLEAHKLPSMASDAAELRRTRSTPLVRRIAAEHGITNLSDIKGTGLSGRVTRDDILTYIAEGGAKKSAQNTTPQQSVATRTSCEHTQRAATQSIVQRDVPQLPPIKVYDNDRVELLSPQRQAIARHMLASRATSPHAQTIHEVDFSAVFAHRNKHKREFAERGAKLTFTSYLVAALAKALVEFPSVNCSLDGNNLILRGDINIGLAVDVGESLVVPVIKHADELSLLGVSRSIQDLADRARGKKLTPDDMQAGTFTLSNHGIFGPEFGIPIINQPQTAIMSTGAIKKRVVVDQKTDAIMVRPTSMWCLSFDHRAIDGASADRFMARLKQLIEEWA